MKKLAFLFFSFVALAAAAQKNADAQLTARLQEYMDHNRQLNFEKVMDYMHPKLFTVAPREAIVQAMQQAFTNEQITFRFDSMAVVSIGPVFKFNNIAYRKVAYFMTMTMTFGDSTDLSQKEVAAVMRRSFEKGFPGKKIVVDPATNAVQVSGTEILFALKDPQQKDWLFLGYDRSKPQLTNLLYPKTVRQYYKI